MKKKAIVEKNRRIEEGGRNSGSGGAGQREDTPHKGPEPRDGRRTWAELGLLLVGAVGVAFSTYLVYHKLRIIFDPDYMSACNLSDTVNCDKVNMSRWSELFGLPVSLYAIPLYVLMAWMAGAAMLAGRGGRPEGRARALSALGYCYVASLVALGASVVMASISGFILKTYCLFCIGLYVVSILAFSFSLAALRMNPLAALGAFLSGLVRFRYPFQDAAAVVVVVCAISYLSYESVRMSMSQSYKARVAQELPALDAKPVDFHYDQAGAPAAQPAAASPVPAAVEEPARALAAAPAPDNAPSPVPEPAAPPVPAPAPAAAPAPSPAPVRPAAAAGVPVGVPGGQKTENGYSFFVTPLAEDDWFYGNPDAGITVVKFADFECAFCQYFAQQIGPVMEKYKDRVRFVMKQYPMNPNCNPYMEGYDKHPNACNAAYAAICAGRQGKFWEMHEKLYASSPRIDPESNRALAQSLGLDVNAYDACLKDPATRERIRKDIAIATRAAIFGTPRTYVNGRLLTGANSGEALEYYIEQALQHPEAFLGAGSVSAVAASSPAASPADGKLHMVRAEKSSGPFWIDAHECSITSDGAAAPVPGEVPAMASFDQARAACEKAGKRICTEEEWTSACAGVPAVDNNSNGWFNDDAIEGNMYPYGPFYEPKYCMDEGDKGTAKPAATGRFEKCRTASGIFDLAGNVGEWVDTIQKKPSLMGGSASAGSGATCNRRNATFGPGYRNQTTGFRCCADRDVATEAPAGGSLANGSPVALGVPVPVFKAVDSQGKSVDLEAMKGKVLLINFFASWCGPCKKEFPLLVELHKQFRDRGLEVVSIGVDSVGKSSIDFAAQFNPEFPIVADEDNALMGLYNVYSMPATFVVDREGIIRFKGDEFSTPDVQIQKMKEAVSSLMAQ